MTNRIDNGSTFINQLQESQRKNKRFRIIMLNSFYKYDFGLKNGSTYLDHHDKDKRDAYRKRHYGNKREKYLIDNLIPSPALLSYYILWGPYTDLKKNIDYLNNLWLVHMKKDN